MNINLLTKMLEKHKITQEICRQCVSTVCIFCAAGARLFTAVGQVIPCPSGYLRSLLFSSHKVPHGPEPVQVCQSFFKVIKVIHGRIPHPVKLHRERITRHHLRRNTQQ